MTEKKSYYAVIPADVRYDKRLSANAKLLYGEITALCNSEGYCWAENSYFAELYGSSTKSVSRWINQLVDYKYIKSKVTYKSGSKEVDKRYLTIVNPMDKNVRTLWTKSSIPMDKNVQTYGQKCPYPTDKIVQDNNTSINTTINNTKNNKKSTAFQPPTLEEVKAYCKERNSTVDPKQFYEYFTVGEWKDSKGNPVRNWKQKLLTWEKMNRGDAKPKESLYSPEDSIDDLF